MRRGASPASAVTEGVCRTRKRIATPVTRSLVHNDSFGASARIRGRQRSPLWALTIRRRGISGLPRSPWPSPCGGGRNVGAKRQEGQAPPLRARGGGGRVQGAGPPDGPAGQCCFRENGRRIRILWDTDPPHVFSFFFSSRGHDRVSHIGWRGKNSRQRPPERFLFLLLAGG